MDKEHKDPDTIDLEAPRLAQYMQKAWKKHQNTVYWVDINLALKKGLKFFQTRSNAMILHETLPAYCIPKVVLMETREVIYEKKYESPRPPPKISLKHIRMKGLGSEVARQLEGEVTQQSKSSQPTQPNPNPDYDGTGRPVVCPQRGAPRSQEIETRSSREEAENHDRTGRPVVCSERASHPRFSRESQNPILEENVNHDRTERPIVCSERAHQTRFSGDSTNFNSEEETNHDRTGRPVVCSQDERSMLNEVDIDFRIPGIATFCCETS